MNAVERKKTKLRLLDAEELAQWLNENEVTPFEPNARQITSWAKKGLISYIPGIGKGYLYNPDNVLKDILNAEIKAR